MLLLCSTICFHSSIRPHDASITASKETSHIHHRRSRTADIANEIEVGVVRVLANVLRLEGLHLCARLRRVAARLLRVALVDGERALLRAVGGRLARVVLQVARALRRRREVGLSCVSHCPRCGFLALS